MNVAFHARLRNVKRCVNDIPVGASDGCHKVSDRMNADPSDNDNGMLRIFCMVISIIFERIYMSMIACA